MDRHSFDADPESDPKFYVDADPESHQKNANPHTDPTPSLTHVPENLKFSNNF